MTIYLVLEHAEHADSHRAHACITPAKCISVCEAHWGHEVAEARVAKLTEEAIRRLQNQRYVAEQRAIAKGIWQPNSGFSIFDQFPRPEFWVEELELVCIATT